MKSFKKLFALLGVMILSLYPVLSNAEITYSTTIKHHGNMGDQAIKIAQIDLTGTYVTNGFTLAPKDFGLSQINQVIIPDYSGYSFSWDRTNAKVKVYYGNADATFTGTGPYAEDITVTDDDSAASKGVALYVTTRDGHTGWFQFVSPTDADATGLTNVQGNSYFVYDSDSAATDSTQVYFDWDASTVDNRFITNSISGNDIYVPVGQGKAWKVVNGTTSAGVAVYIDEDSTNSYERLLYVGPQDVDGTGATDDTYFGMASAPAGTVSAASASDEVDNGTSLASLNTIEMIVMGH